MSKSSWKINKFYNLNKNDYHYNRSLKFMESDIDRVYNVYNGKSFFNFKVIPSLVGFKFGDIALTRKYPKVPQKWLKAKKKFK